MNLLICFVLILSTYYRFGTACSPNSVEIHNQLGPDIILHFHCRCKNPKCDVGNQQLKFKDSYVNKKKEGSLINFERQEINCLLRYDKYYLDVRVFRQAAFRRCGILRSWLAEKDGIYFKTRPNETWRFRYHWNVGK
ncbi:hypothetical protein BRARA_C03274 [Brassica rapa]|uniref:Uncharacterized protein n=2 Tax=Brassica TaxID=3705 RepID=A0A398A0I2_BRACM|nr:hypothetical protein BRARA_C03274 [Brassica rapa]CAF2126848.1 unnamed protein product [Brassica napus]CAG7882272.1 unnamed protein product [Brassica rapa]VDC81554.1 unnamed protein product [Brassica rapa]